MDLQGIELRNELIATIKLVKEFGLGVSVHNGELEHFLKTGYLGCPHQEFHLKILGGHRLVNYFPSTGLCWAEGNNDYMTTKGKGVSRAIEIALYDNFFREDVTTNEYYNEGY